MLRARLLVVLGFGLMATGLFVHQPISAAAHPAKDFSASYGENTEANAFHRWQSNQSRHWRQAVTRK